MHKVEDEYGKQVTVGSKVKVVHIDSRFLASLPEAEGLVVASMLNEVLCVCEVDEYGHAWVEKGCGHEQERYESHSLALASPEMERVDNAD